MLGIAGDVTYGVLVARPGIGMPSGRDISVSLLGLNALHRPCFEDNRSNETKNRCMFAFFKIARLTCSGYTIDDPQSLRQSTTENTHAHVS